MKYRKNGEYKEEIFDHVEYFPECDVFIVRKNGFFGLISGDMEMLLDVQYSYISDPIQVTNRFQFIVKDINWKYGLYDLKAKKMVVEPSYLYMTTFGKAKYVAKGYNENEKDEKIILLSWNGTPIKKS